MRQGDLSQRRDRRRKKTHFDVLLAAPYRGFPADTIIGRIWTTEYFHSGRVEVTSVSKSDVAIIGRDDCWLLREFDETNCGDRKARLGRIRPGRQYGVAHVFGIFDHEDCVYEAGEILEVSKVAQDHVHTVMQRKGTDVENNWKRQVFETLVNSFTIKELNEYGKENF